MAIVGNKRETTDNSVRKVGLAVCEPLVINPSKKQLEELLGKDIENSPEYLSKDDDGNKQLNLDFWLKEIKTGKRFKMKIKLVDKTHYIPDNKIRFVDAKGNTSYFLDNKENLVDWMQKNNPRIAKVGEVEMYKFMRAHQGEIDFMAIQDFSVDWDRLMKGDVSELNELKHSDFKTNVLVTLAVRLDKSSGELKHYQTVYNRAFLPGDFMRYFRNAGLKRGKQLEEFINDVTHVKHGCKDFFGKDRVLREMYDYDPSENPLVSDSPILASEVEEGHSDVEDDVAVSTDY